MSVPKHFRNLLIKKHGKQCAYCGCVYLNLKKRLNVDHRIPKVAGGPTLPENLALSCRICNTVKADKSEVAYRAFVGLCMANGIQKSCWIDFARKIKFSDKPERWNVDGYFVRPK